VMAMEVFKKESKKGSLEGQRRPSSIGIHSATLF